MVKWAIDVDTHTNQSKAFSMITPSSQGAGLDIEAQRSVRNSDYFYRTEPIGSIEEEIQRQKTKSAIAYRQEKSIAGFKSLGIQDLEEQYKEKSFNNLHNILNSQLKNENFKTKVDNYFKLTGIQQLDMNIAMMRDALQRVGVLLPDEKQKLEQQIRDANPIIITFEFAIKVASDPDVQSWTNYFLEKILDAATGVGIVYVSQKISETAMNYYRILKKNLQDILNANRRPDQSPEETVQTGNQQQQGGPPGGGGAGIQQQGGYRPGQDGQGFQQGGVGQGGVGQGGQQGGQQGGIGQGGQQTESNLQQVHVHEPDTEPEPDPETEPTVSPEDLPDNEHPIFAAIASLLINRFTLISLGAVVSTTVLMANMPLQFRNVALEVVQDNRPPMIMIRELITRGGHAIIQAYRNSIYGNRGPLEQVGPEVIRRMMEDGRVRPDDFTQELPPIHEETSELVRSIVDLVDHLLSTGPSSVSIRDFSQIKGRIIFASRLHSTNQQLIDLALQALANKGPGYTDSVQFCKEFLQIVFDNTESYPKAKQNQIMRDFNKVIRIIKEYQKESMRIAESQASTSSQAEASTSSQAEASTSSQGETSGSSAAMGVNFVRLQRISDLFRENDNKKMIAFVNNLKRNINRYNRFTRNAINSTDGRLSGRQWLRQFLEVLLNNKSLSRARYDEILKNYNP